MFTNWLTGSTSSSSTGTGSGTPAITRSSGLGGGGIAGSASSLVMSSPPDVILEVGPAPSSVRFVAHSLVLGMHSGYLRSAIRLDEASSIGNSSSAASSATTATGELLLYLSNVTADQFAPLLTYMYTGYLDLTVDNIFAVLLATHVLHMPRALEICRSFLARAQTEGYLNGNPGPLCPAVPPSSAKVIRPIPSKATMPNFGFMPHMPQAPPSAPVPPPPPPPPPPPQPAAVLSNFGGTILNLEVAASPRGDHDGEDDEEEDVEVFIDSNTVTDNELEPEPDVDMDCNVSVVSSLAGSSAGSLNIERLDVKPTPAAVAPALPTPPSGGKLPKSKRGEGTKASRGKSSSARSRKAAAAGATSSGLQVARAPVPAAQLEQLSATTTTPATPSKFIIDVASCDGPVRFRRILNTAYGHKPEGLETNHQPGAASSGTGGSSSEQHRSQQSVSYSFHQQMARAISSQQRQLSHQQQQQQQEESENSGDAVPPASTSSSSRKPTTTTTTTGSGGGSSAASTSGSSQELYVCVYCKHTFKSQYCYQKHAKRHLNPLSLTTTGGGTGTGEKKLMAAEPPTTLASLEADSPVAAASVGATTALLRREVRPLDMNVQYYPCKTCGSKFPSYYFVHKHRKMCHADEIEASAATNNNNNNTSNTSSSASSSNSNNSNHSNSHSKREVAPAPASGPVPEAPGEDQPQN